MRQPTATLIREEDGVHLTIEEVGHLVYTQRVDHWQQVVNAFADTKVILLEAKGDDVLEGITGSTFRLSYEYSIPGLTEGALELVVKAVLAAARNPLLDTGTQLAAERLADHIYAARHEQDKRRD